MKRRTRTVAGLSQALRFDGLWWRKHAYLGDVYGPQGWKQEAPPAIAAILFMLVGRNRRGAIANMARILGVRGAPAAAAAMRMFAEFAHCMTETMEYYGPRPQPLKLEVPARNALELIQIKPEARTCGRTAAQMLAAEAGRIRTALPKGARVIALDERGQVADRERGAAAQALDAGSPASGNRGRHGTPCDPARRNNCTRRFRARTIDRRPAAGRAAWGPLHHSRSIGGAHHRRRQRSRSVRAGNAPEFSRAPRATRRARARGAG